MPKPRRPQPGRVSRTFKIHAQYLHPSLKSTRGGRGHAFDVVGRGLEESTADNDRNIPACSSGCDSAPPPVLDRQLPAELRYSVKIDTGDGEWCSYAAAERGSAGIRAEFRESVILSGCRRRKQRTDVFLWIRDGAPENLEVIELTLEAPGWKVVKAGSQRKLTQDVPGERKLGAGDDATTS
ncbi:hypothetical protein C8R43DRAFT_1024891 [Mycena crocata]|nr:hypothetical protein C8R43DRAFT_1024840 [Mycena crocata]KAJ7130763.1 hypothetical protein C8R43DRAFT_1024891 [Mycena crocata]